MIAIKLWSYQAPELSNSGAIKPGQLDSRPDEELEEVEGLVAFQLLPRRDLY